MMPIKNIITVGVIAFLSFSCGSEMDEGIHHQNLNAFKMLVNGQTWTPSVIDSCHRTFKCEMSSLNQENFYYIEAYRDPSSIANLMSENFFEIRVMKVEGTGIYLIDGPFEDFSNYARLTINDLNGKRIYQNKTGSNSFKVTVTELFPNSNSSVTGIGGSFDGILYNIENPADSVTIKKGEFVFRKTNWYNFNQCKE